jgi:hypothetical protein
LLVYEICAPVLNGTMMITFQVLFNIHYEKAVDQFVGGTVTGIPSLEKITFSPAYFDLNDAPVEVTAKINNLVKMYITQRGEGKEEGEQRNSVIGPMFPLVRFLFASICYHYQDLDRTAIPTNRLRTSPMFIAATTDDIRRYEVCCYPWNKSSKTPVFTGVPPHVLMMSEME